MADRTRTRSRRSRWFLPAGVWLLTAVLPLPAAGQEARPNRVLTLEEIRSVPRYRLNSISNYRWAAAAALSVLERELGFPELRGKIQFYPRKEALRAALHAEGHASASTDTAVTVMDAISSAGCVHVNVDTMQKLSWPPRIWVLAHEFTHLAQYQLAQGRRGSSPQWLREGMAEWVGLRVLEALGQGSTAAGLKRIDTHLRRAAAKAPLPALADLASPVSWIRRAAGWSKSPLYDMALAAAGDLIERHGPRAALDYFAAFAYSDDASANFRRCFGEDQANFEARFHARFR